jgi:hypothetical protein
MKKMIEQYKQLLARCDCKKGHACVGCLKARGFALACQEILAFKPKERHYIASNEREAMLQHQAWEVVELAKQQGHLP